MFWYLAVVLSWIWRRTWPVKRCLLLAGLWQAQLVMQLRTLKKSREGMKEKWQVLRLNLQLVPILIYTSSRVVCYLLIT